MSLYIFAIIAFSLSLTGAFYLPGLAPNNFCFNNSDFCTVILYTIYTDTLNILSFSYNLNLIYRLDQYTFICSLKSMCLSIDWIRSRQYFLMITQRM